MLATCDDSLEGLRDRALLCFGFASGGRRHSELAAADLRDLRRVGPQGYIYRLEHSKTQQAGVNATSTPDKPVLDRAAQALEAWLAAADIIAQRHAVARQGGIRIVRCAFDHHRRRGCATRKHDDRVQLHAIAHRNHDLAPDEVLVGAWLVPFLRGVAAELDRADLRYLGCDG